VRAEEPIQDDPVIRKVAAVRPTVAEEDLSPDGWRARAIKERVLAGSAPDSAPRPRARRPRRSRWTGALAPAVGIAVALAVVAVVLVAVGSHARRDVTTPGAPPLGLGAEPPAPASLLPAHGGMRGLLSTPQLVGSGPSLTAIFEQCPQCRKRLRGEGVLWQSRSADGGRTWRTERISAPNMDLGMEAQAGGTLWATGDVGQTPRILVSHDGGLHYIAAASAATPASQSPLALSDGTVWVLGNRCDGHRCRAVVLSGPVGGNRLVATSSQPALRPHVNGVQAVIGADGSTVVVTGGYAATDLQTYVSHDRGRSWTQASYPCRRPVEGDVYPTSAQSLWAVCLATRPSSTSAGHQTFGSPEDIVRRSADGGRHWTTTATLTLQQPTLSAVTDDVAWITGLDGTVKRTTDGGRSWRTVLHLPGGAAAGAELAVQNPQTATVVVTASGVAGHSRRTDLVAYRTTDGGARWTPTVIKLPKG
jgi:photosystem II stability/assembly factor-like uncharacterized protein